MPISTTYYLNAPTLATATAVFTDSALTTCAPNGYYSDGVITRQQVGCVLQIAQNCPSCCIFTLTTTALAKDSSTLACSETIDTNYYYQTNDCLDNGLAVGDLVFYDSLGVTPLPNGWYSIATVNPSCPMSYHVVSGAVTEFVSCCTLIPYGSSTTAVGAFGLVCGQEMPSIYYTNSVTPTLVIGDAVYEDEFGLTPLANGWYITPTETPSCPDGYEVLDGVILTISNCCA
jgi:hypothetical protein